MDDGGFLFSISHPWSSVCFACGTSFCSGGRGRREKELREKEGVVWRDCPPWRTLSTPSSLCRDLEARFTRGHHPAEGGRCYFHRDNANCHPPLFRGPFVSLPARKAGEYFTRGSLQNAAQSHPEALSLLSRLKTALV